MNLINCFKSLAYNPRPLREDEYEKNGIPYCKVCNEPRVYECLGCRVNCICQCQANAYQKKEDEMRKERNEQRRDICFDGNERYFGYTFENHDKSNPEMLQFAKEYVDNFDEYYSKGKGLLLFGDVGLGKSFLAGCVANALIDKGKKVKSTRVSDIYDGYLQTFDKKDFIDSFNNFDLLILDDLGTERKSEGMLQCVFSIIDNRYNSKKPIIVTTNLPYEVLFGAKDDYRRITDRLQQMCFYKEFKGVSHRKEILRSDSKEHNERIKERMNNDNN